MTRHLALTAILLLLGTHPAHADAPGLELPPYTPLWAPAALTPLEPNSESAESLEGELDDWTARTVEDPQLFSAWTHTVALQLGMDRPSAALRTLQRAQDAELWTPDQQAQLAWLRAAAWLAQEAHEKDILEAENCLHAAEQSLAKLPQQGSWDLRRRYAQAWIQCEWGNSEPAARFLEEVPELPHDVRFRLQEATFRASSEAGLDVWGPLFEDALAERDTLRLRSAARIGSEPYLRWLLENMGPEIEEGLRAGRGGEAIDFRRVEDTMRLVALEDDAAYAGVRQRMETMRSLDPQKGLEVLELVRAEREFTRLYVEESVGLVERMQRAIEFAEARIERCRELGLWYEACRLGWGLQHAYLALDEREEGLRAAQDMFDAARQLGDPYYRAMSAHNLFASYADKGFVTQRLRVVPELVEVSQRFGVHVPGTLATNARAIENRGDLEAGFEMMSRSYREARRRGDLLLRFIDLEHLVYLSLELDRPDLVSSYVRTARDMYDDYDRSEFSASYNASFDFLYFYVLLFDAWSRPLDSPQRIALLQEMEDRSGVEEVSDLVILAQLARAETAIARGDFPAADVLIREARERATAAQLPYKVWRADALEAQRCVAMGDELAAVEAFESSLGLLEDLGGQLPDSEQQAEFLVPARGVYDDYVRFLLEEPGGHLAAYSVDERSRARALQGQLDSPGRKRAVIEIEEVQSTLSVDQLLLQFRVLDDELVVWLVGRELAHHHRMPVERMELESRAAAWLAEIQAGLRSSQAAELGEILLGPVSAEIASHQELVIIADAPLSSLPWALLELNGSRLLETHVTSSEVSGRIRVALVGRGDGRIDGEILALGYDGSVAPEYLGLPVLPSAEHEIEAIEDRWPRVRAFTGPRADRAALRNSLPGPDLVHLAAHAGIDVYGEPFILLAPDEEGPGLLGRTEIAALELLGTELVVLAGCETARAGSRQIHGDLSGMVGAIFAGGSRRLIASLWKVDDQSTLEFMCAFYAELLGTGRSPAQALRQAQLAMARDARYFERDWGAFVLYGP